MERLFVVKKYILGIILCCLFINISKTSAAELNTNAPDYRNDTVYQARLINRGFVTRKYILGPNDILSINLLGISEFNQDNIRIQPDGNIVLPPLGLFKAAGLTIEELREDLIEGYKKYVKNPQVFINLTQSRPFIVYISGGVLNPGGYELNTITNHSTYSSKPETFIERKTPILTNILIAAGGISYDADVEHIKITNQFEGTSFEVNLLDIIENGDSDQDIYLMSGDSIFVPKVKNPLAIDDQKYRRYAGSVVFQRTVPVKVYGYVNTPGLIKLDPAQSLNINSAITAAGGYLKDSAYAPSKVYLSRLTPEGTFVTRKVNPRVSDVMMMPNDVVYVPEKWRPLLGKTFDYLTRMIEPFYRFSRGYNSWDDMFNR